MKCFPSKTEGYARAAAADFCNLHFILFDKIFIFITCICSININICINILQISLENSRFWHKNYDSHNRNKLSTFQETNKTVSFTLLLQKIVEKTS